MSSPADPGLRRVRVHAGATGADLLLPAAVPVASLIPSIFDALGERAEAKRYELRRPGAPAMPLATTLSENGVDDGAVLVVTERRAEPPLAHCEDAAAAVAAALAVAPRERPTRRTAAVAAASLTGTGVLALTPNPLAFNAGTAVTAFAAAASFLLAAAIAHRAYRDVLAALTLSVVGTAFAALAGFLAVPGTVGAPHVLLAAMAAAATSVLAARVTAGGVALTAVSCFAAMAAAAALLGMLTAAPPHAVGAVSALVSLALLGMAGKAAIWLGGLSPRTGPAPEDPERLTAGTLRADAWLTSLLGAFASSAAAGAILAVATAPPGGTQRLGCVTLAAATAALLLLRARADQMLIFVTTGTITAATAFGVAAVAAPTHGPWIAAVTAMMAAAPVYLGFVAPALTLSPIARRGVDLIEPLALTAMVPLTCWLCGIYGAVRGLNPTWA
jgi:type VII secretion integral membrane protein EccD